MGSDFDSTKCPYFGGREWKKKKVQTWPTFAKSCLFAAGTDISWIAPTLPELIVAESSSIALWILTSSQHSCSWKIPVEDLRLLSLTVYTEKKGLLISR